jgi:hypothetical protein
MLHVVGRIRLAGRCAAQGQSAIAKIEAKLNEIEGVKKIKEQARLSSPLFA